MLSEEALIDTESSVEQLSEAARRIRYDIIKMTYLAGSGHPGGSLSIADILSVLYFAVLRGIPDAPDRDRVILSKGHACPALYAALSEAGHFPRRELWTLRKLGSRLQGHPAVDKGLPGIEVSTGSLGQGLSIAAGLALSGKHLDDAKWRVFSINGDGEMQEGQIWEAAMFAGQYNLDNLIAIIDRNHLQIDGDVRDVMNPYPLEDKFDAFGWEVMAVDGHNIASLLEIFDKAFTIEGKPVAIIADTVKGKGVSFMENQAGWHGKAPNREQAEQALAELGFSSAYLDDREENKWTM